MTLVGQFVEQIPEDLGAVGQTARVVHDAAHQHHLELKGDLEHVRGHPAAHVDTPLQRLFAIPLRCRQRGGGVRIQLPARIVLVQDVLRCVPIDITIGIECQTGHRLGERRDLVRIFGLGRVVGTTERRHRLTRSAMANGMTQTGAEFSAHSAGGQSHCIPISIRCRYRNCYHLRDRCVRMCAKSLRFARRPVTSES